MNAKNASNMKKYARKEDNMSTTNKNLTQIVTRYLLLPIVLLGSAVLLSQCGKSNPAPASVYKAPKLVGVYQLNYNKSLNKLSIQNIVPPSVTPSKGLPNTGGGFTVTLRQTATPTLVGTTLSGTLYITTSISVPQLTGVVMVVDKLMTGTGIGVGDADIGNGFRNQNPTAGPWAWWFTGNATNIDGSTNYGIPSGGRSVNKTISFIGVNANFAVSVYIYAFEPSGVVVNRTNDINTPVANAFVMLGTSPGDPNYWAQNSQPAGTVVNYLAATNANGYFAFPITTVVGNGITYTAGAIGSG